VADAVTGEESWRSGVMASSEPSARYPTVLAEAKATASTTTTTTTTPHLTRGSTARQRLRGGRAYRWSVRWHDGAGAVSPWSAAAVFRTPLLPAQWVGVGWHGSHEHNLYRSEFNVPDGVKAATLFICGLGWSRPLLNGVAASRAVLTTAPWRNNERSNGYSSIDVLHTLVPGGRNALGVALGHGWRLMQRDPLEPDHPPASASGPAAGNYTEASGDNYTRVLRAQLWLTLCPPHLAQLAPPSQNS
jgi:hypothetical protein